MEHTHMLNCRMVLLTLGLLSAGCREQQINAGDSCAPPTGCGGGTGGGSGAVQQPAYHPFTPVTRGATYVKNSSGYFYALELMMTDGSGPVACSLTDPTANPGRALSRVLFTLPSNYEKAPICGPQAIAIGGTASATFERWDANGTKTENMAAVGGAVSFASSTAGANLSRCDVSVTFTFSGGAVFSDSFSYNYEPGSSTVSVACLEGPACSCEPWQTCNSQRQCVNLSCVPAKERCSSDAGVDCCAGAGACIGGLCCMGAGNFCNPNANLCCGKCEYHPYSDAYFCSSP